MDNGNNGAMNAPNSNKGNAKRQKSSSCLLILLAAVLLQGCSHKQIQYSEFKELPPAGWEKSEALVFQLPDSLPSPVGNLTLNIRHDNYYPYRNLWITVDYISNGRAVASDTVNIALADQFGNWFGSGLGKLFQHKTSLAPHLETGKYEKIILWHNMRCDTVPHITDIGLSLSAANN